MWPRVKQWFFEQSNHYPIRWWWPVLNIWGGPMGQAHSCYMTRVHLGPNTPWGRLYFHIFWREDIDRDPHDHPYSFWTFPLTQGYWEMVYDKSEGCNRMQQVRRWRWTYRPPTHTHRVTNTASHRWPLYTLVWRSPTVREWGFWVYFNKPGEHRGWLHWKEYLDNGAAELPSDRLSNRPGIDDKTCPGV